MSHLQKVGSAGLWQLLKVMSGGVWHLAKSCCCTSGGDCNGCSGFLITSAGTTATLGSRLNPALDLLEDGSGNPWTGDIAALRTAYAELAASNVFTFNPSPDSSYGPIFGCMCWTRPPSSTTWTGHDGNLWRLQEHLEVGSSQWTYCLIACVSYDGGSTWTGDVPLAIWGPTTQTASSSGGSTWSDVDSFYGTLNHSATGPYPLTMTVQNNVC